MHSELHGNVVHHGVELLLLVSMLFLLAIPKSLLILKEFVYTSFCRICYCGETLKWLSSFNIVLYILQCTDMLQSKCMIYCEFHVAM